MATRKDKNPEKVSPARYVNLCLVVAPGLPVSEVKSLKKHFKEALADPSYTVVTNYPVHTDSFSFNPETEGLVISAPDIPTPEVDVLQSKFARGIAKAKRTGKPSLIFVNYDVRVETRPVTQGNIIS